MANFRVSLGNPEHGWLPVRVEIGSEVFDFCGSDVPNNPVQELVNALAKSAKGLEATVWWHLEPDGYYFQFEPSTQGVRFRLLFAERSNEAAKSECGMREGTKEDILLPIWRSLRRFQSLEVKEPHWPIVEFRDLDQVRAWFVSEDL